MPVISEGLFDNKTFSILDDGIWYLHARFKNDIGWGPVSSYKIGIDTVPPISFEVISSEGKETLVTAPTIVYETKDQPSGIAYYKIFIDGNVATTTLANSFTLPSQKPGKHSILVEANDFAGNKTGTTLLLTIKENPFITIGGISLTQFQFFAIFILFLIIVFGSWLMSYRLWRLQLYRRVIIAERDVSDVLASIDADAKKVYETVKDKKITGKDATEVEFLSRKIIEKIEKGKRYIIQNIREISQK